MDTTRSALYMKNNFKNPCLPYIMYMMHIFYNIVMFTLILKLLKIVLDM